MRTEMLVLLAAAASVTASSGLASTGTGGMTFGIDTAVFQLGDGTERLALEVYESIPVGQLAESGGLASVQTDMVLLSAEGDTVAVQQWVSEVERIEGRSAVNGTLLIVEPGAFDLYVTVTDLENGSRGAAVRRLEVSTPGMLSELEVANAMVPAAEGSTNPLRKGGFVVFPAADGRFDLPGEQTAYIYAEAYGLGGEAIYRQSRLLNAGGELLFARPWSMLMVPEGASAVGLADSVDLGAARISGLHYIEVSVASGGDTATVRKPVMIAREAAAPAPDETPPSANRYLEQFPLVLSSDQRSMFNRLTSREAKERFYDSYWASTPGREDFEERVTGAGRYSTQFTEGWRTDRGRVFIIYGPPDEVESVPFQVDGFPYEIWYYYQAGTQYFVFLDRNANGNYMQIYSTVDGEVSYPNWEQMLRPIRVPTMDDGGLSGGSAPSERIEAGCLFPSVCSNAAGPDPRHGVPAAAPECRWS